MPTNFDSRQTINRAVLDQLTQSADQQLDDLLTSINSELTAPLKMVETSTPNRTLNVEAISIQNSATSITRTIQPIGDTLPSFTAGTVALPATSGSNIVVTPGTNILLTISASRFIKALISLDSSGNLVVTLGAEAVSEAAAAIPTAPTGTLSIGYMVIETDGGGNVQNVTNADIFQFVGGGGGGSALDVEDEGSSVDANVKVIDFTGPGVAVSSTATGEIEVAISSQGLPLTKVTGTTQTLAVDNAYEADNASGVDFTTPATAAFGTRFEIHGTQGWTLVPDTGQTIFDGNGNSIDDTGTISSTSDASSIELLTIIANDTFLIVDGRGQDLIPSSFAPTEALYLGGDDLAGASADDVIYSQLFATDATATEGNTLAVQRHQSSGLETTIGQSYIAGGYDGTNTEIQDVEKWLDSGRSTSSIGNLLSAIMSNMFGAMHSTGVKSYAIGAKTSSTEQNLTNKAVWAGDTFSSLGAVLVQTMGQQGGAFSSTHAISCGGSRGGSFRTTTISSFDFNAETEASTGSVLSTTSVAQEGIQDNLIGVIVGGDNTTNQKFDFSTLTVSQPSSILVLRENPAAASSTTHGYVHAGAPVNTNTTDKYDFSTDAVAATTAVGATTREQTGLAI
jgi:hypothetical protein